MATLTQIKNKADTVLAQFWSALQTRQVAHFAKRGKYFQLLVTSKVVDGVDTTFLVRHPSDEPSVADVSFSFDSPIPFQIAVDEWVGSNGKGYRATATVELLDGRKFRRSRDSSQNDSGWYEVLIEVLPTGSGTPYVPPPDPIPPIEELAPELRSYFYP